MPPVPSTGGLCWAHHSQVPTRLVGGLSADGTEWELEEPGCPSFQPLLGEKERKPCQLYVE